MSQRFAHLGLAIVALALMVRTVRADVDLPSTLETAIQLKILGFDSHLLDKAGDAVVIAIVHDSSSSDSAGQAVAIKNALVAVGKSSKLKNKRIDVVSIPFNASFETAATNANVDVIYVCTGLDNQIDAIASVSRKRSAPTLTNSRKSLLAGLAVAVVRLDDKPHIVLNLSAVKKIGMKLDPALLRLAEVIE